MLYKENMKILLVEDTDEKARQVIVTIDAVLGTGIAHLERANSFLTAIRMLQIKTYDLLILDLLIPTHDNDSAVGNGGKNVLEEIFCGDQCCQPSHIICLTAFEDVASSIKSEIEKNRVNIVIYSETDSSWHHVLGALIRNIDRRLKVAGKFPADYNIDIAIVTSSPHVELSEVTKLPGPFVREYHQDDSLYYYLANWTTQQKVLLSVVACAAPSMGMTAACVTACKVIERWRPHYLVMTGISAGTKKDQDFGDVLVAESAFDYGSGKIVQSENGERLFIPSPNPLSIDSDISAILQRWEREQCGMDAIRKCWHVPLVKNPKMIVGILASGAAVIADNKVVEEIMSKSRKVVGLEMEAYGIFQAARLARSPRPKVLVAKSVSDFADNRKNDSAQHYAAFTSARFVYEFFTQTPELKLGKQLD